ncbi:TPA: acylphosphatase [Vibrio vulnificus]|uniref:acylphosphatase n=1 Tax=Vibrio sp. 05-20-BW147 TaxID=2575834 RepID=UPI0015935F7A|nr:acylphosphatase [Vibrio sp. 05-20-BW147]NVC63972.1 acylphosphatase [Vibrio sp. 05-20-BW147]HAS6349377.1 acylphosphatase [Vibrio vulnificus]
MTIRCEKFVVSGIVQGVGFRYHTSHQGLKFNLVGYAKNLNNGDVEVIACGEPEKIEEFAQWLKHGPKTARVDELKREEITCREFQGFEIL